MFSHVKDLQFEAKPDGPDAAFARRLQEVLGGKWGEMTVANQYLFQGWNCRLPGKYKDLLLDVGTEEMGHVEMIVTMITRLLDNAPLSLTEGIAEDPGGAATYAGENPAHFIHGGVAPCPPTPTGCPGTARSSPPAATCWPISSSTSPPRRRVGSRSPGCST